MDTQILYDELSSDPAAHAAYIALSHAGGRVFIVGGAVRDTVLGKTPKDIDLMVTGLEKRNIEQTLKALPGYATFAGKNFGVYHYHYDDSTVEIAMPRTETSTGPGHQDFDINADASLSPQEDLGRRDFTANALAFDIASGELIDPYNGLQDIQDGKLRLIAPQSFHDDSLRIVRALVAYSVHGLQPDEFTLEQMTENAAKIRALPAERIQQELDKLMSGSNPAGAVLIAYETGVLQYICPELENAMGFDQQNKFHDLPVGEHCLQVLKKICELTTDPDLRLAALLHDIGKPPTFWQDEAGAGHFYENEDVPGTHDHADVGADMTNQFMKRMKYPNARQDRVTNLVQNHMFPYFESEKGARKFLNRVGDVDTARDLMDIRQADASGKRDGEPSDYDQERIQAGRALIDTVSQGGQQGFSLKDLAINGTDLIAAGIQPGPMMKTILNTLLQDVIEEPSLNNKPSLLQLVKGMHENI